VAIRFWLVPGLVWMLGTAVPAEALPATWRLDFVAEEFQAHPFLGPQEAPGRSPFHIDFTFASANISSSPNVGIFPATVDSEFSPADLSLGGGAPFGLLVLTDDSLRFQIGRSPLQHPDLTIALVGDGEPLFRGSAHELPIALPALSAFEFVEFSPNWSAFSGDGRLGGTFTPVLIGLSRLPEPGTVLILGITAWCFAKRRARAGTFARSLRGRAEARRQERRALPARAGRALDRVRPASQAISPNCTQNSRA
jgi:hypothetical protein